MLYVKNEKTGEVLFSRAGVLEDLTYGLFSPDLPGEAQQVGPVLYRDDQVWQGFRYVRCQKAGWIVIWAGYPDGAARAFMTECDLLSTSAVIVGGLRASSNILSFLTRHDGRSPVTGGDL